MKNISWTHDFNPTSNVCISASNFLFNHSSKSCILRGRLYTNSAIFLSQEPQQNPVKKNPASNFSFLISLGDQEFPQGLQKKHSIYIYGLYYTLIIYTGDY